MPLTTSNNNPVLRPCSKYPPPCEGTVSPAIESHGNSQETSAEFRSVLWGERCRRQCLGGGAERGLLCGDGFRVYLPETPNPVCTDASQWAVGRPYAGPRHHDGAVLSFIWNGGWIKIIWKLMIAALHPTIGLKLEYNRNKRPTFVCWGPSSLKNAA